MTPDPVRGQVTAMLIEQINLALELNDGNTLWELWSALYDVDPEHARMVAETLRRLEEE